MAAVEPDMEGKIDLLRNSERALETAQAALDGDTKTYEELVDIEGPEDASNYFGVLRYFFKEELENGSTMIEHLWELGAHHGMSGQGTPFENYEFEHPQEIVQTLENLENYFENLYKNSLDLEEHEEGIEQAYKWAYRIHESISEVLVI